MCEKNGGRKWGLTEDGLGRQGELHMCGACVGCWKFKIKALTVNDQVRIYEAKFISSSSSACDLIGDVRHYLDFINFFFIKLLLKIISNYTVNIS